MAWWIWLIIFGGGGLLVAGGIISMLAVTVPISRKVYEEQLVRTSKEKWGRSCSAPDNEEQVRMWNDACAWAERNKDKMQEVSVTHEGLRLCGELYRFGGKKCVIILQGRTECLRYSCYFAPPYVASGYNVLVIDSRAHGSSDGKYNTVGIRESGDVLTWIRFLLEECGMEEIWLHAICIGSAAAILAMTSENCPPQVKGLTAEGSFVNFRETFKRHMQDVGRPWFPVLDLVMLRMNRCGKVNVYRETPWRYIGNLKQRALFLFGEQDLFSVPKKSRKLFARCGSPDKKLVWFPKGAHSHLRINNTSEYDGAILDFLKKENERT